MTNIPQLRVSHLSDARQIAQSINGALRRTDPISISADQTAVVFDRPIQIAGLQVLQARDTGWVADTGTASKTAHATYTAGTTLTYSAAYVQAELTATGTRLAAVEAALQAATQEIKAMKDLALLHGFAGA